MKKQNLKTQMIAISLTILTAALMQACGHGNGSTAAPLGSSVSTCYNSLGQYICSGVGGGQLNSGLYQACTNISSAQYIGSQYGVQITGIPSLVASPDGTQNVCEIQMQTASGWVDVQPRAFLGPNATVQDPVNVGLNLQPNDIVSMQAIGSSSSAFIATCSESSSADFNATVYAQVAGLGVFPLPSTQQTVPVGGGGSVSVGLNQGYQPGDDPGCFAVAVIANVTRCVDSAGNAHQCP